MNPLNPTRTWSAPSIRRADHSSSSSSGSTSEATQRAWLFSRATLQSIPACYEEISVVTIDRYLPSFLTQSRIPRRPRLRLARLFCWGFRCCIACSACWGCLVAPLVAIWRRFSGKADGSALTSYPWIGAPVDYSSADPGASCSTSTFRSWSASSGHLCGRGC